MKQKEETLSPMQQELLNRADEIFKSIGNVVNSAAEFGKEQIPDIAYQFIMYSRAYISLTAFLAFFMMCIGLWLVINVAIRDTRNLGMTKYESDWVGVRYVAILAGIIITVVSTIIFFFKLKMLIMVWFAPKIFIILGISELIRG